MFDRSDYLKTLEKRGISEDTEREYSIPVTWAMAGIVKVKAKSLRDAIGIVDNGNNPLPEGEYMDDSMETEGSIDDMIEVQENDEFDPREVLEGTPEIWQEICDKKQPVHFIMDLVTVSDGYLVSQYGSEYGGIGIRRLGIISKAEHPGPGCGTYHVKAVVDGRPVFGEGLAR